MIPHAYNINYCSVSLLSKYYPGSVPVDFSCPDRVVFHNNGVSCFV